MKLLATALLTFCAGAAAAGPITPLPRQVSPTVRCDVTVSFVSICCGPDQATETRIRRAVIADHRVVTAYETPWGREGESTLCLRTRTAADARAIATTFSQWVKASASPGLTQVSRRRR